MHRSYGYQPGSAPKVARGEKAIFDFVIKLCCREQITLHGEAEAQRKKARAESTESPSARALSPWDFDQRRPRFAIIGCLMEQCGLSFNSAGTGLRTPSG